MYKKVSTDMNFVEREKEVEKFWDDENIFQKSMDEKEGCPDYIFYDGPPTANGKPHIGHVLTRVIKDMIPRYRTMKAARFATTRWMSSIWTISAMGGSCFASPI